MRDLIARVPLALAGLALALAVLGILLQPYASALHGACSLLALAVVALVGARVAASPSSVREELRQPEGSALAATLPMALMLLAAGLPSWAVGAAFALWLVAILGSLGLLAGLVAAAHRRRRLPEALPAAFVGLSSLGVAAMTASAFGLDGLGYGLFWVGFACAVGTLVVAGARCAMRPLGEGHRPLWCLGALPMAVALVGYLACCPDPDPLFATVMLGLSQGLLVVACAPLPRIAGRPFSASFTAMTFPFAITALALAQALPFLEASGAPVPLALCLLSLAETGFAASMTLVVGAYCLRDLARIAKGRARCGVLAGPVAAREDQAARLP